MSKANEVNIEDIVGEGVILERLNFECQKVLANIQDENTNKKPREINLKIKFTPNKNRTGFTVYANTSVKLAPITEIEGIGFIGKKDDKFTMHVIDNSTPDLPFENEIRLINSNFQKNIEDQLKKKAEEIQ